jgi:type IV fimbrial biogenesis protein FimT
MRQNAARTAAVNEFLHALYLARSEAIKRGQTVSICKTLDGASCSERGDWNSGWLVFVDLDADDPPARGTDEELIHRYMGWPDGSITSNRRAYSFRPYSQSVVNGTIVFCDRRGAPQARAIIVSQTGRPRITERDAGNRPLACARG